MPSGRLIPHSDHDRLLVALRKSRAENRCRSFRGEAYRAAAGPWSEAPELLSGAGALRYGSRWLAPGVAPVLHLASTPELALSEALARHRRANVPEWQAMPLVVRGVRIDVDVLFDLGDGELRRALGVSATRLRAEDWEDANHRGEEALTQAIGRAALAAGIEALRVPSAADAAGRNLVIFPGLLEADRRPRSLSGRDS